MRAEADRRRPQEAAQKEQVMRIAIAAFSIALATAFGVAGCASSPETKRTVGETSEDAALTAKVKTAIATDVGARAASSINVETYKGVVQLSSEGKLFNNAAQAWNHEFYWHSRAPKSAAPSAAMRRRLERDFGTYESFIDKFAAAANGQFGSGWAWLVDKDGKLEVVATSNADTPMAHGVRCLLTLDVWEHAYYLDYRNQRERYVQAVVEKRLNWAFAEENLKP